MFSFLSFNTVICTMWSETLVYTYLQIGNWSRWLTDLFGMDAEDSAKDDQDADADDRKEEIAESKSFHLLNQLSDLLMLPKDMLLDRAVRKEVSLLGHNIGFLSSNCHFSYLIVFSLTSCNWSSNIPGLPIYWSAFDNSDSLQLYT